MKSLSTEELFSGFLSKEELQEFLVSEELKNTAKYKP